jgi:peroxiredoxin Q/BCP
MPSLEGQPAPAFSAVGSDGKTYTPAALRGAPAVIYFYPKDDTPGCTKEACGFRDGFAELQALGVTVLGVSPDGGDSHRDFIAKYGLPFVLLSDPARAMMTAYGAYGEKMMYGKPVTGVIRSTVLLDAGGRVVRHWARVAKAETHPADVLACVRDLVAKR